MRAGLETMAQFGGCGRGYGDAGLLHVGARYYDPQVGRFISRDPVLSEHPYLYCEHEPVMRVDPSGYVYVDFNVNIPIPLRLPLPIFVGGGFQYGNTHPGGSYRWHFYFDVGIGSPGWSFTSSWDYITPGPFAGFSWYYPPFGRLPWLPGLPGPGGQYVWSPHGGTARERGIGSPGIGVAIGWVF